MYLKHRLEVDPYYVILEKGWDFWAWWSSSAKSWTTETDKGEADLATARRGLSSLALDTFSLPRKVSPTQATRPCWEQELARKWEIHLTDGKEVSDFPPAPVSDKMSCFLF